VLHVEKKKTGIPAEVGSAFRGGVEEPNRLSLWKQGEGGPYLRDLKDMGVKVGEWGLSQSLERHPISF